MFNSLDASNYKNSKIIYKNEFVTLLSKIVLCYKMMINDNVKVPNNENAIRDILYLDYLNNNSIREKINLKNFLFNREVPEDKSIGRTDIKIQTKNSFEHTEAYYIIECKRLDNKNTKGKTGLNGEYVKNGIMRFVNSYYSTHYRVNGMIGFVVEKMDIDINTQSINGIMKNYFPETNTIQYLQKENSINNFNYYYLSKHNDINAKKLELHNLMFDFSKNINK